jgi:hypothetical protein
MEESAGGGICAVEGPLVAANIIAVASAVIGVFFICFQSSE